MQTPMTLTYNHCPVIFLFPFIFNIIQCICIIHGIVSQLDTTNDFILLIGHFDIYIMHHILDNGSVNYLTHIPQ